MSSALIDITEAVVAELNNPTAFSQAFTATRGYVPIFDLQDMASLHVTAVPGAVVMAPASRPTDAGNVKTLDDYVVEVGIQKQIGVDIDLNTACDEMLRLVQEISDHMMTARLDAYENAMCNRIENSPAYSDEYLRTKRQFASLLKLSYRTLRRPVKGA